MASPHYTRPYNPDGVIAYFISFRSYGTWFHGDGRGSVHRSGDNVWRTPKKTPHTGLVGHEHESQKRESIKFDEEARRIIDKEIRITCEHRKWNLRALNVQPDHVHVVVTADCKPERVMNSFKSWASRRLREAGLMKKDAKTWSRHGSTCWLWTPEQLVRVIGYVVDGRPWPAEWDEGVDGDERGR